MDGDQGLRKTNLHGRPRLQLSLLLAGPLGWLGIAYLGSLAVLFVAAFWHLDSFSGEVVKGFSFQNFETLWNGDVLIVGGNIDNNVGTNTQPQVYTGTGTMRNLTGSCAILSCSSSKRKLGVCAAAPASSR